MLTRVTSPLPEALEALITRIVHCVFEVHRRLGAGLKEIIYEDALVIELAVNGLSVKRQFEVVVEYRDTPLRPQVIDLIVEDQVVVEIKCVERLHPNHRSQVVSYLRATGLRIGLLVNFQADFIKGNIRRVIL